MYSIIRTKSFLTIASLSLMTASISACKDNDDSYSRPQLIIEEQLDSKEIIFPTESSEKQLTFTSNRQWTSSYPSWIDVSPSHGDPGTYTIRIKALNNTGAERMGNITFTYGSASQTFSVKQNGSTNPVAPSYEGMPLSEFISKYYAEGKETIIPDNVSFQAVVISDKKSGNTQPKNANVQGLDAGIVIRFKANHKHELGSVLNIQAKGAKLQRYLGGTLQLELAEDTQAVATGETREQTPIKASLKDIYDGKYENMLVELENVQFEKANEPYLRKNKDKFVSTFHALSDCVTKPTDPQMTTLSLSISSYANEFKDKTKTEKRGSIVGIVSYGTDKEQTKKYRNLIPRNFDDIKLNEERCNASSTDSPSSSNDDTPAVTPPAGSGDNTGSGTSPAPAPNNNERTLANSTQGKLMITAYVSGSSNDKFIQLYNPTNESIDLSMYKLVMQTYSTKNALTGKPTEEVLSGELPGKSVIVYKHKDARSAPEGAKVSKVANFNGNDNIDLRYNENGNWVVVDALGAWGSPWLNSENKNYAQYTVLKRNADIMKGNVSFTESEWRKTTTKKDETFPFLNARP